MVSQNPYEAPQGDLPTSGVKKPRRLDLASIARFRRVIIICLGLRIVSEVMFVNVVMIPMAIASSFLVCALLLRIHRPAVGISLGAVALLPCLGHFVLIAVYEYAGRVLKDHGANVGWFGRCEFPLEANADDK